MLCARKGKQSHLQKEFRLEKENFARGTGYVGIEICMICFFFVKPTVLTSLSFSRKIDLRNIYISFPSNLFQCFCVSEILLSACVGRNTYQS